mmetsp:Transcript_4930/g.14417  ORF Transcript_4930/g.14417 Transcript_4930/m.14417 type:complete len:676 (-) Transcript_4930:239-2266(-)
MAAEDLGLPLDPEGDLGATAEPMEGDLVHIVGHGPACVLRAMPQQQGYEVRYPNGDTEVVERGVILARQAGGMSRSNSGGRSPTGPKTMEYLARPFDDEGRTIRTHSATFSLIATMVGGGVLSLPYAMSQCGLVLGVLVLLISALLSAWTLDMLVECARATGRSTYELVGHAAFGEWCRKLTVLLVFSMTWLATVAYFVLLQDLLAPTAELVAPSMFAGSSQEGVRRSVGTVAAVALAPMCYKGNLSALRFLCFASVGSVLLVGLVLAYKAIAAGVGEREILLMRPDKTSGPLLITPVMSLWPVSYTQALYVFPMFGISFLCHFNALPTHHELQRPTRQRMRRVLGLCLGFTTALYFFVSIAGYAWAGECTCGNILLNFARDDVLIAVGRVALGLVLMCNFPLVVQPSRNALFRLIIACGYVPATTEAPGAEDAKEQFEMIESQPSSEVSVELAGVAASGPAAPSPAGPGSTSPPPASPAPASPTTTSPAPTSPSARRGSVGSVHAYLREDTAVMRKGSTISPVDTFLPKDETVQQGAAEPTVWQRSVMTTGILVSSLLLSMFMKSILVVWSVLGSTVAFMIAFIMPAAFWYRLVGPRTHVRRHFVRVVLAVFVVLALACSTLTAMKLDAPPCPLPPTPPTPSDIPNRSPSVPPPLAPVAPVAPIAPVAPVAPVA